MLAIRVIEQRLPVVRPRREVDVEAGAALVVERLGHERRQLAEHPGEFLDGGLEPVCPVGGVESLGVPQVDLKLSRGELVVRRDYFDAVVTEVAQDAQQHVLRVALETRDVDVAGDSP